MAKKQKTKKDEITNPMYGLSLGDVIKKVWATKKPPIKSKKVKPPEK